MTGRQRCTGIIPVWVITRARRIRLIRTREADRMRVLLFLRVCGRLPRRRTRGIRIQRLRRHRIRRTPEVVE